MSKSVIAALTAAALLVFGGIRATDFYWSRSRTLAAAEARADNLSFILSEYLHGLFAAGDASLRQLTLHSADIGGSAAPSTRWAPTLTAALAGLPGLGSLTVTDASGVIRHSTLPLLVGQSRADQFLFTQLASQTADELVIGEPYLSVREPRQFLIPIGRRLTRSDGTFDGIVTATIVPSAHRDFFRTVDVGPGGALSVFHPNGFVLFREPSEASPTGRPAVGNPVFDSARTRKDGIVRGALDPGGPDMISGFHTTAKPPLIVAVSLDREQVLMDSRHQVRTALFFFAVVILALGATLYVLFRQMDSKALAERALAETRQMESIRLREVNDRLSTALESEQRASTLKEEFLMMVSHELRTPLTAIHGWARMLASGDLDDGRRRRAVDTIERNARAQTRLINDLLDVSSAVGGKMRLDLRPVRLGDVVGEAVESLRPAADAKTIRVHSSVDPAVGSITADPDRLQQVVWNLLSNALKFTPAGGRVDLRVHRLPHQVEIAVTDSGAGITPEFLPHVFERFRQQEAGSTRRHGGLGLGLAIVHHLVELHGGSVEAASEGVGRGATFRVRLPADTVH